MTQERLKKILEEHALWLRNGNGRRADLNGADLSGADLSYADLSYADLSYANLKQADLRWANLSEADLRRVNLSVANLSEANLKRADLRWANLSLANLRQADLSEADFSVADLRDAKLGDANLSGAILRSANLGRADLTRANLSKANLRDAKLGDANLSEAEELLSSVDFMEAHFERTERGYIAYKTFNELYTAPVKWDIKVGSVITENVNFDRCSDCGCGINVATYKWVRSKKSGAIWKVLIRWEWLCGVCVPYNSDGKIRCEKVELLGVVR